MSMSCRSSDLVIYLSLSLLWWALPVVDIMKASTLLAFSMFYALVVAKSEKWFANHHYAQWHSLPFSFQLYITVVQVM